MTCHYCGYTEGGHDKNCPKPGSPEMDIWREGYRTGRAGQPQPESETRAVYNLGWLQGESALESAQNEHDHRFNN